MFTPLRYDSGKIVTIKSGTVSGSTITKFDALDWASGYLQRATSASTEIRMVALEDKVTAAGEHEDIQVLIVDGVEFECDCTHNSAVTQRGTYVDLTDHDTLDNDATTTDVFYVTENVGAAADKKVRGYFVHNIA
ncbi:hypothetical protein M0R01_04460 [bacterium]|jgi:hypothetical protein|nr:hypothetical protein [bacterium]